MFLRSGITRRMLSLFLLESAHAQNTRSARRCARTRHPKQSKLQKWGVLQLRIDCGEPTRKIFKRTGVILWAFWNPSGRQRIYQLMALSFIQGRSKSTGRNVASCQQKAGIEVLFIYLFIYKQHQSRAGRYRREWVNIKKLFSSGCWNSCCLVLQWYPGGQSSPQLLQG